MGLTALWWWIDRWRKSSAYMDLTLAEQGAYRNLLDEAHLRGGCLPDDERILAKACGDALEWPKVRAAVMARFERRSDGWHHSTLEDVLRESMRRAEKQRVYRDRYQRSKPATVTEAVTEAVTRPVTEAVTATGLLSPSPSPSPSPISGSVGNEPTPRAPLHTTHRSHAACGRVCVPAVLHTQFVAALNRDTADADLRAWYLTTNRAWSTGPFKDSPTGADAFAFWRARFDERWPAQPVAKARWAKPEGAL